MGNMAAAYNNIRFKLPSIPAAQRIMPHISQKSPASGVLICIFFRYTDLMNMQWTDLRFAQKLRSLGGLSLQLKNVFRHIFLGHIRYRLVWNEMYKLGTRSLTLINVTALFIGMVFAVQISYSLSFLGAKYYLGTIIGISIVRELGPVVTALLVAGRAGSGIAAEIGSMRVTEQVDALRAMGISPSEYLMVPRIIAMVIMVPVLTAYADFIGITGGLLISRFQMKISSHFYLHKVFQMLAIHDITSGLAKSLFFGFFIAIIACYHGFSVRRGAAEVGRAATKAVVASSITILVADFFLTRLFMWL
jgi:phospholipid/cholesterol/gamma-HCH transport system permease protein